MFPRHLAATLIRANEQYPIITLTGPRQSGKTTLLRDTFPQHQYVSLEAPDERHFATEDPRGFLARFSVPAILDEVQHVPDLFSYIQVLADERGTTGQFILLPFSTAELHRLPCRGPEQYVPKPLAETPLAGDWPSLAATGFYPPVHDRGLRPFEWASQYFQT